MKSNQIEWNEMKQIPKKRMQINLLTANLVRVTMEQEKFLSKLSKIFIILKLFKVTLTDKNLKYL